MHITVKGYAYNYISGIMCLGSTFDACVSHYRLQGIHFLQKILTFSTFRGNKQINL